MPDTMLEDLPEWLVVDEILVRLPPKDVLRCRAVRKCWRAATSTDRFILDHHRRLPSLPIIERHNEGISCLAAAGDQNIRHILQYTRDPVSNIAVIHHAACDGLLILSRQSSFYICNPATRKCAPLPRPPLRPGFSSATVVAFYRHQASGEHRVLWAIYSAPMARGATVEPPGYFVLPVGSDQPRCVQWPTVLEIFPATRSSDYPPVHHRSGLHWALGLGITVFDTLTETFRQMSRPAQLPGDMVSLLDLGGDLALRRTSGDCVTLDVWAFRYRIDLRVMEASPPLNLSVKYVPMMAVINGRELLVQYGPDRMLRCDIDGVFLGNVESEDHESSLNQFANSLSLTRHRLQESMISLPLFETRQEDAVNKEPPFTIVL
ncbi:hypothetical protein CFC21_045409 [Triticum aestivum]|uniref:F-box domain-containing protein n=2 Tax=Triticum aestivum TaxID=4565 RepID=A0A3B6GK41_WHEAT|nr:uncharacterized protein LOC123073706 [Triticum aestivum]XP_044352695.1 uncharacterized protein LOC123073706 [Triticum aestivum]KAF7034386.1 hypothetical protein CFC21_045409 [Triticum aestivum]